MTPVFSTIANPTRNQSWRGLTISLILCLVLYAIDLTCMALLPPSGFMYATNYALPFDLVVGVPTVFYFLVIRRRGLTPVLVLPVIWIGMALSLQFVQPGTPSLHLVLLPVAGVVDVIILVKEARRFLRSFRTAKSTSTDPLDWFIEAFFVLTRNKHASYLAGMELTVWYYALASWRRTPDIPEGSQAFYYHKKSGYVALVGVLLAMVSVETFALHLLVAQWNEVAAILLTIMSLYTALWLFANTRAVVLNPLLVDDDALTLRYGMYFNERIALDMIERIDTQEPPTPKRQRMNFGMMGTEPCWIVLQKPIQMRTFIGKSRPVQAINVSPDEVITFKRLISKTMPSASF